MSDANNPKPSELAQGWQVQPEPVESAGLTRQVVQDEADPSDSLSSISLMLLGVFGGFALLSTWGWLEVANFYSIANSATATASGLIGGVLQQIVFWVAPLAPAAWFLTTFVLSRRRGAFVLGVTLLLGTILTLPYPVLLGGGSA